MRWLFQQEARVPQSVHGTAWAAFLHTLKTAPSAAEALAAGINAYRGSPLTAGHQLRTPLGCLLQHTSFTLLLLLLHHGERGRGRRAHGGAITTFDT